MFSIEGNSIYITQGDSAYLTVSLEEINGCPHEMQSGDTVVMTVKDSVGGTQKMQITFTATSSNVGDTECTLYIPTSQTGLAVGRYSCDIQYKTGSDVYTIFPVFSTHGDTRIMKGDVSAWNNFWILPQITTTV